MPYRCALHACVNEHCVKYYCSVIPSILLASIFVSLVGAFRFSVNRSKEINKVGVSEILKHKTSRQQSMAEAVTHSIMSLPICLCQKTKASSNNHIVCVEAYTAVLKSQS